MEKGQPKQAGHAQPNITVGRKAECSVFLLERHIFDSQLVVLY